MTRIQPIERSSAPAQTQKLLDGVEKKLGMLPNMIGAMAQSHAAAEAYLGFSQALAGGALPPQLREQIALAVAQTNGCNYCLAAHSAIGSSVGLSTDQVQDARTGNSPDRKTESALQFAQKLVDTRGSVSDSDVAEVRNAGFGDGEIAEIIAHVSLNTFTNYFNKTAGTTIDFPPVAEVAMR